MSIAESLRMNGYGLNNLLSLLIITVSCSSYSNKRTREISQDLNDAIRKKVFVYEYKVPENPYYINDTVKITVNQAWVENQWRYSEMGSITKFGAYQLVILCDMQDVENYPFEWTIGMAKGVNFRYCGKGCIVADYDSLPSEVEFFPVQKGILNSNKPANVIGQFKLIRK